MIILFWTLIIFSYSLVLWMSVVMLRITRVRQFKSNLLAEEMFFIKKKHISHIQELRRYTKLPTSFQMAIKFWVPLEKYEAPLGDFYSPLNVKAVASMNKLIEDAGQNK